MDISGIGCKFKKEAPLKRNELPAKTESNVNKAGKDNVILSDSALSEIKGRPEKAKWTVLVYAAGDNFLERVETIQLGNLEEVGSIEDVNMVVQYDRNPKEAEKTNREGEERYKSYPSDTARYYLKKSSKSKSKSVIEKIGKTDSGGQKNLEKFLEWGMEKYPAENYLIILKNHGGGFTGILSDESEQSFTSIPEVKEAILNAEKKSGINKEDVVLGLDACIMGQAEVAYELKDAAKYMIAPQTTMRGGWPYRSILGLKEPVDEVMRMDSEDFKFSNQLESLNKEQLVEKVIKSCEANRAMTPTMAAYDLGRMDNLREKINIFSRALLETDTPLEYLKREIENAQVFEGEKPYSDMRDIYSLAENLHLDKDIKDEVLKKASRDLMQAAKDTVILDEHGDEKSGVEFYEDAHGISFYFPILGLMHRLYNYQDLALAKETMFDEAVTQTALKIQKRMQEGTL